MVSQIVASTSPPPFFCLLPFIILQPRSFPASLSLPPNEPHSMSPAPLDPKKDYCDILLVLCLNW